MLPSFTRRRFLQSTACGFGALASAGLMAARGTASSAPTAALGQPHFPPRAKRVIFLFMQGGVSQVDSFDYKPRLAQLDGQQMPFDDARRRANVGQGQSAQRVMKSPWAFRQYAQTGHWASDLFPQLAARVDDLCFLHAVRTEGVAHGPATLFLHCGATNSLRPSMGSWVVYGLGSENENLPGFISLSPSAGNGGARNYGNAFLPAEFQGVSLGRAGGPAEEVRFRHLDVPPESRGRQRLLIDRVQALDRAQQARTEDRDPFEAAIRSYELAWRMQMHAPGLLDLSGETASTLAMYGIGEKPTDNFGRQCLLARRFCEAGVRFVQLTYGDGSANPAWDQHSDLPKHAMHAAAVDRPIAALLVDLKQRGLIDDTIVWWGSEFGRTPYAQQNGTGRDHNPDGFTVWLAGGGFRAGFAHGATDELGHQAVEGEVHMHDLHATILHQLGIDHERLTFRESGRDFRLTDVYGNVVRAVLV